VGSGPFPTELFDETGDKLRKEGHEFGATTGRPRRCGWLDLVALKYVVMINGVTQLIMTKADVLDTFDTIKVATAYEINGEITNEFPYEFEGDVKPIYKEIKAWNEPIINASSIDDLPLKLKEYIAYIEKEVGVPIRIVSIGPDRKQTLFT